MKPKLNLVQFQKKVIINLYICRLVTVLAAFTGVLLTILVAFIFVMFIKDVRIRPFGIIRLSNSDESIELATFIRKGKKRVKNVLKVDKAINTEIVEEMNENATNNDSTDASASTNNLIEETKNTVLVEVDVHPTPQQNIEENDTDLTALKGLFDAENENKSESSEKDETAFNKFVKKRVKKRLSKSLDLDLGGTSGVETRSMRRNKAVDRDSKSLYDEAEQSESSEESEL